MCCCAVLAIKIWSDDTVIKLQMKEHKMSFIPYIANLITFKAECCIIATDNE